MVQIVMDNFFNFYFSHFSLLTSSNIYSTSNEWENHYGVGNCHITSFRQKMPNIQNSNKNVLAVPIAISFPSLSCFHCPQHTLYQRNLIVYFQVISWSSHCKKQFKENKKKEKIYFTFRNPLRIRKLYGLVHYFWL